MQQQSLPSVRGVSLKHKSIPHDKVVVLIVKSAVADAYVWVC